MSLARFLQGHSPRRANPTPDDDRERDARIARGLLTPPDPRAALAATEGAESGAEAWEQLSTRGLIPADWVDNPEREFLVLCPSCEGRGWLRQGPNIVSCGYCYELRGWSCLRKRLAPIIPEFAAALGADVRTTMRAEALAREAMARVGRTLPVVRWGVLLEHAPALASADHTYGTTVRSSQYRLQRLAGGAMADMGARAHPFPLAFEAALRMRGASRTAAPRHLLAKEFLRLCAAESYWPPGSPSPFVPLIEVYGLGFAALANTERVPANDLPAGREIEGVVLVALV